MAPGLGFQPPPTRSLSSAIIGFAHAVLLDAYHSDMPHVSASIAQSDVPARIRALATQGIRGELALCVGSGVSKEEPTGLPTGRELATDTRTLLLERFPEVAGCPEDDLVCLGDKLEVHEGGRAYLVDVLLAGGRLRTATTNFSHEMLAALLSEGAIVLLTTNWDTCIERAWAIDAIVPVISTEDHDETRGTALYKLHGCATRPASMLISSGELARPPLWVRFELTERLGRSAVAFLGLGELPAHSRKRVEELVGLGGIDHITVVTTGDMEDWVDVFGDRILDHHEAMRAANFLEALGSAYCDHWLMEFEASANRHHAQQTYPGIALDFLAAELVGVARGRTALELLTWARASSFEWECGATALFSDAMLRLLMAIALLSTDAVKPHFDRELLWIGATAIEAVCSVRASGAEVSKAALERVAVLRRRRQVQPDEAVLVLSSGHEGPLVIPELGELVGATTPDDLIGGEFAGQVAYWSVHLTLEGETLPEGYVL